MKNIALILFLIFVSSCGKKQKVFKNESVSETSILNLDTSANTFDGVIYFSRDNGANWKNASDGLPEKVSIGLGAIAISPTSIMLVTKERGAYFFDFKKNRWIEVPTDDQIIKNNPNGFIIYQEQLYIGTQLGGVYFSNDRGATWTSKNAGLKNLTIRRLAAINSKLYAGTNDGLYMYNNESNNWTLVYGQRGLQVNGIAEQDGTVLIGTNRGMFKSGQDLNEWQHIFSERALHNIAAFDETIYAMTYNELFSSTDSGLSWKSVQKGLPKELYTFNVINHHSNIFAGQWDGVYRRDISGEFWTPSSNGLPRKFAATNLQSFNGILIVSTSERILTKGVTTER